MRTEQPEEALNEARRLRTCRESNDSSVAGANANDGSWPNRTVIVGQPHRFARLRLVGMLAIHAADRLEKIERVRFVLRVVRAASQDVTTSDPRRPSHHLLSLHGAKHRFGKRVDRNVLGEKLLQHGAEYENADAFE